MEKDESGVSRALKKAVVAGHICLDVIPDLAGLPVGQFESLFCPGHLISVGEATFSTGGPVSNVGLALHHLGIPTQLIAKIGDDPFGRAVYRMIRHIDENLLAGISTTDCAPTSYSIIISPPGVDRIFLHCPGVNDLFCADDISDDIIQQADLLHFGYPPIMRQMYQAEGAELAGIFQRAKAAGITTSLDMAFPNLASPGANVNWSLILEKTLPSVDIFLPSIEEILFLLRRKQYESLINVQGDVLKVLQPELLADLGAQLLSLGAKIVVLKLGHHGLYLRSADRQRLQNLGRAAPENLTAWIKQELYTPCFQVDVVGTTGAGDATIAGFLSAFLRGLTPQATLTAAVGVGACNVEAPDALSGLLNWEETLARIEGGWQRHPNTLLGAAFVLTD